MLLERVERHVVACLSVITAPPPQPFRRAAEKAEVMEKAAEAECSLGPQHR